MPKREDGYLESQGIRLHYVAEGEGPLVLLLHGFPEFWYSWRHQLPALAEAGFRAVALDQRGYNLSDKPAGLEAYRMPALMGDVSAAIAQFGNGKAAALIGHDWGAAVAWTTAAFMPHLMERLIILNLPHPAAMLGMRDNPAQLQKSWYVFMFQAPEVPEAWLSADDFRRLRLMAVGSARPGTFSNADLDRFQEAWSQPGALTAAINWYRANLTPRNLLLGEFQMPPVSVPTRILWGVRDAFLERSLGDQSQEFVAAPCTFIPIEDAGHWLQQEKPDVVTEQVLEFLRQNVGIT
ncbi:MAG: alpha/beta fold hydrolase [Dehalococcoidia bacterium]